MKPLAILTTPIKLMSIIYVTLIKDIPLYCTLKSLIFYSTNTFYLISLVRRYRTRFWDCTDGLTPRASISVETLTHLREKTLKTNPGPPGWG